MFLSKRTNGVYYLFYLDDLGKRHGVSTGCCHESDALKFLREYDSKQAGRRTKRQCMPLSRFIEDYLEYSHTVHRPKSTETNRTSLDAAAPLGNGEMTILKDMESFDQQHDQYMQDLKSGGQSDSD